MSDRPNIVRRFVARLWALLPADWRGDAGKRFHNTLTTVSEFAEEHHIRPGDLADEGVTLGRRKLEGLANKEFASAARDFAEAEETKVETELKRRSLKSKVRKEEADARLAQAKALEAEVELYDKMRKIGVAIRYDEEGTCFVLPASGFDFDIRELTQRRLSASSGDAAPSGDDTSDVSSD